MDITFATIPNVLAYGFILIILLASLAIHECAHLTVARHFSIPVSGMTLGIGPSIKIWKGNSFYLSLGIFPIGGFTHVDMYALMSAPLRSKIFTIMAGCIANLCSSGVLYLVGFYLGGDCY
ncbi:MAG: hypothetical protein CSYNP_04013 [Syntrophus sp. SKADARSKE-3]|nr:hypothetical protein [Syntrophus sp. SKADARSKE-3]